MAKKKWGWFFKVVFLFRFLARDGLTLCLFILFCVRYALQLPGVTKREDLENLSFHIFCDKEKDWFSEEDKMRELFCHCCYLILLEIKDWTEKKRGRRGRKKGEEERSRRILYWAYYLARWHIFPACSRKTDMYEWSLLLHNTVPSTLRTTIYCIAAHMCYTSVSYTHLTLPTTPYV